MPRFLPNRHIAGLAVAAALLSRSGSRLEAQTAEHGEAQLVLNLEGTEGGWCLQFLIDPTQAGQDLPDGALPVPASDAAELHAVIQRLITDDPQYARWVPSQVCTWFFDAISSGGHRTEKGKKSPLALTWWGVLARSRVGADTAAMLALRTLGTNNWHIQKSSETVKVNMRTLDLDTEKVPETGDDRYTLEYGKTVVTFDGHAAPDTMLTPGLVSQVWWTEGGSSTVWRAAATLHPASTHALVGALRIQGKGDLADALKASPIRLVGPIHSGGDGEVKFYRW